MRSRLRQFSLSNGSGFTHGFDEFASYVLVFHDPILRTFSPGLTYLSLFTRPVMPAIKKKDNPHPKNVCAQNHHRIQ